MNPNYQTISLAPAINLQQIHQIQLLTMLEQKVQDDLANLTCAGGTKFPPSVMLKFYSGYKVLTKTNYIV